VGEGKLIVDDPATVYLCKDLSGQGAPLLRKGATHF
jgi:hypothetical protein